MSGRVGAGGRARGAVFWGEVRAGVVGTWPRGFVTEGWRGQADGPPFYESTANG